MRLKLNLNKQVLIRDFPEDGIFFRVRILQKPCFVTSLLLPFIADLRGPDGPPSGAPYPYRKVMQTHEFISVFMVSSIACGCVRITTTTKFSVNYVSAEKLNEYGTRALCEQGSACANVMASFIMDDVTFGLLI